jgi:hypothetical protein
MLEVGDIPVWLDLRVEIAQNDHERVGQAQIHQSVEGPQGVIKEFVVVVDSR